MTLSNKENGDANPPGHWPGRVCLVLPRQGINQALALFANRSVLIRHFATYLNSDPPREQILFIHGPGGNGKTLLLRYLEKHCCKRLTPVDWLRSTDMNDDEFRDYLTKTEGSDPVAKASLDFSAQPTAERDPKDPFSGLLYLRAQLAEANIPFPLFDFACTWYVHKTRRWTWRTCRKRFPPRDGEAAQVGEGGLGRPGDGAGEAPGHGEDVAAAV